MTDQDRDDLEARLHEEGLGFGIGPALLCQQAADAIAELRVKNAALVDDMREAIALLGQANPPSPDKDPDMEWPMAAHSLASAYKENTQ